MWFVKHGCEIAHSVECGSHSGSAEVAHSAIVRSLLTVR
jgi:hypothetical protein